MASLQDVSFRVLDTAHQEALSRAVHNCLATESALETFAELIDGLPTENSFAKRGWHPVREHPVRLHTHLCNGAKEAAEKLRREFNVESLRFSPSLLEAFGDAHPASKAYGLRLIELVAASLHQIAVFLHQGPHLHDPSTTGGQDIKTVTSFGQGVPEDWTYIYLPVPPPILFNHPRFVNPVNQPNGVHDVAGYWAENQILGGVPIFDRSMEWAADEEEPNVYFDSDRFLTTGRICQLIESQQADLLRFLALDPFRPGVDDCPLPILVDLCNGNRIDHDDAIPVYRVYRDVWERTLPLPRPPVHLARFFVRDCFSDNDYPELAHKFTVAEMTGSDNGLLFTYPDGTITEQRNDGSYALIKRVGPDLPDEVKREFARREERKKEEQQHKEAEEQLQATLARLGDKYQGDTDQYLNNEGSGQHGGMWE